MPRLGVLRTKGHRRSIEGVIRFASISEQAGRWFVALTVVRDLSATLAPTGAPVGIDIGLTNSLVLSTGEIIQSPRALKMNLAKLRHAQKAVARSQRNSMRRRHKVVHIARLHAQIGNIRSTWLHSVSSRLTREYVAIGHENLAIAGLMRRKRGFRHARTWADLGAAELFRQLDYKAAWRGVTIIIADRFYPSSKLCSSCGWYNANLTLKDRLFVCSVCGLTLDRDLNAALNLRPVVVMPTDTLNARGENVRPDLVWQIPLRREPSSGAVFATA